MEDKLGPPDDYIGKNPVWKLENGDYVDERGTVYPATHWDENRPGIDTIWSLRTDNPYAKVMSKKHDKAFDRMLAGYKLPGESATTVTKELVKDATATVIEDGVKPILSGLSTVAQYPIMVILGGVGGFFRYLWLDRAK